MHYKKINIALVVAVTLLAVSTVYFYLQYQDKSQYIKYTINTTPDVELMFAMSSGQRTDGSLYASGSITGFVAFEDVSEQPMDMRQYYTITAIPGDRFKVDNIFKVPSVAPRVMDDGEYFLAEITSDTIRVQNDNGVQFDINTRNREVIANSPGSGQAKLITNSNDFFNLMLRDNK